MQRVRKPRQGKTVKKEKNLHKGKKGDARQKRRKIERKETKEQERKTKRSMKEREGGRPVNCFICGQSGAWASSSRRHQMQEPAAVRCASDDWMAGRARHPHRWLGWAYQIRKSLRSPQHARHSPSPTDPQASIPQTAQPAVTGALSKACDGYPCLLLFLRRSRNRAILASSRERRRVDASG